MRVRLEILALTTVISFTGCGATTSVTPTAATEQKLETAIISLEERIGKFTATETLDKLKKQVQQKQQSNPQPLVRTINSVLSARFEIKGKFTSLNEALNSGELDSTSATIVYLIIAESLGQQLFATRIPNRLIISNGNGLNWDPKEHTYVHPSSLGLSKKAIQQGAYLKPLTRTELLGTLKTFYGQNLFAEGKIADAQNILDEAEDTSNPQLWYLRGQIQLQQNNKSEALYSFTQAYTLDDQFLDAGDKRAYLLAEERIGDAIELYLELIKKDPNSPRRFHAIGKVLFIRGDYDEAILALERSLQLDSRKLTSYHLLAQCYCKKSDYYQAIECYRHILQIDPKNSGAYKEMGLIYLRIGQEIEASKCFKLAGKYGLSIIK